MADLVLTISDCISIQLVKVTAITETLYAVFLNISRHLGTRMNSHPDLPVFWSNAASIRYDSYTVQNRLIWVPD